MEKVGWWRFMNVTHLNRVPSDSLTENKPLRREHFIFILITT